MNLGKILIKFLGPSTGPRGAYTLQSIGKEYHEECV